MSSDHYPEVRGDESGLVPNQTGPKSEWPKKIRTLTAAELDRLTIDSEGRFLWDGKPVNYGEVRGDTKSLDPLDRGALDLLDRAAAEIDPKLAQPRPAEPGYDAEPTAPAQPRPLEETPVVDYYTAEQQPAAAPVPEVYPADATQPLTYAIPARPEKIRVSLSFLQSFGLGVLLLSTLLAAAGIAASGLVAAHSWACRTGMTAKYCPAPPPAPPAPPARPEIPA